ncbi:MAG: CsgG/HfaB family protein [Thermodesulfobacteriota bacterium]|nr:CsgG/HfaB family protein [Thermodesulfobacteriota bacterium]
MSFGEKKVGLCVVLIFLLLGSSVVFGQTKQPAVAIKKPVIGEGVTGSVVKHLNLTTMWSEMESSFRATRKFRVLSRNKSALKAIREEQKFAASEMSKGDAAETGQFNNANYLILPTVQDFKFYRQHTALPNFDNKYKRSDVGVLQVSAQMVDTSTGQIMTTFYLKSSFRTNPLVVNGRTGSPNSVKFTTMAKEVAAKLADQFIDSVYPMKVVKRDRRGRVIINRGKDSGLKKGQILEVFYADEDLIDPDTGESLGSSEEYVGKVKVVRINPKITIAIIVSEEDYPIGTGDILRLPQ